MTDRDKLIKLFEDIDCPAHWLFPNNAEMLKLADYLVTNGVTVREPGRWISRKHDDVGGWYILLHCDKCDQKSAKPLNFCPNCGARMEVE